MQVEISNRTDNEVWLGLYNVFDAAYVATIFPWGARLRIEAGGSLSVHAMASPAARWRVMSSSRVGWTSTRQAGQFGRTSRSARSTSPP